MEIETCLDDTNTNAKANYTKALIVAVNTAWCWKRALTRRQGKTDAFLTLLATPTSRTPLLMWAPFSVCAWH